MRCLRVVPWVLVVGLGSFSTHASQTRPMSFEEVVQLADVIVLGSVADRARLATMDPASHEVLRSNTVRVEKYLKGTGPDSITVLTLGGDFEADTDHGKETQSLEYVGATQLPSEGTRLVLFLRSWGGAFMVCSATSGLKPVTTIDGRSVITVKLRSPELMSPAAKRNYEELRQTASTGEILMSSEVPVELLPELVERAIAAGRPPKESRH